MRLTFENSGAIGERVIDRHDESPVRGSWSAIVLAGTRPEGDPLASHFGVPLKALVPVAGEPMIVHVLRALMGSASVARIVILAQAPELLEAAVAPIPQTVPVDFAVSGEGIADSLFRIAGTPIAPWPVLVTTGDHPLLTSAMVEHFLGECGRSDIGIGVVDQEVLLKQYPQSRRTWLRFKGGAFTGANLFAMRTPAAAAGLHTMATAESDRKAQLKLLWRFGPTLALGAAARLLTLQQAVTRGGKRLDLDATAVALPFADAGIDVDRVEHQQLVEAILAERAPTR